MEMATETLDDNAASHGQLSAAPKRKLVQTKTHLVPGEDSFENLMFMLDRICQEQWSRDYDPAIDRWNTYGARFDFDNRRCFFLPDHGYSRNDDEVPVSCYEWTGRAWLEPPRLSGFVVIWLILRPESFY